MISVLKYEAYQFCNNKNINKLIFYLEDKTNIFNLTDLKSNEQQLK